ncbi:ABC transporter permease [Prolixibacter sp. NT017]|uniref:ABC transporter permease n=1 Tax=Prolixibacter sp. NT017 TaxID=2652390 RepID=UPI00127796D4|nr:ABC transporter permease [Prolixibacter sp. NT017]GET24633.1 ABC transporter permease [Prolixibacter sp. NT017]
MNILYHFHMTIRTLRHNLRPTLLLLISMSVGLVTFILVSGYVSYEQQYDRVFPYAGNIYRITTDLYSDGKLQISIPECERDMGSSLKKTYPEVTETGFLAQTNNPQYKIGENIFKDTKVYFASPGLLNIFSFQLLQGDGSRVLTAPYTVLLSESTARKYFGNENPVGKTITKYPAFEYQVVGVYKDIPRQAHFHPDMLLSFHDQMHLPPPMKAPWGETDFYTYLKVHLGTDLQALEQKMNQLAMAHKKDYFEKNNQLHVYHLQPLKDIHLNSHLKQELQTNARADYLYILLIISLLIVLAVGLNYIHFSFTRALNHASATGLKKVFGANRKTLIGQSLTDSLVIHSIATAVAFLICILLLPFIQNQFGITLDFSLHNRLFWFGLGSILLISMIVNGIIPGYLIGRFSSLDLFKLKYKPLMPGISFRQLFVVGQFAIVMVIITGIIGINKQVNFLKEKNKGFNLENTIAVKVPQNFLRTSQRINNLDAFEQDLLRNPSISGITQSNRMPGETAAFNFSFAEKGTERSGKAAVLVAGVNYLKLFDIKLLAGNDFEPHAENVDEGCIINQSCLNFLGYKNPQEAVGRVLKLTDESALQNIELKIRGVCSDFNFQNMREHPGPMILFDWTKNMIWGNYFVKLKQANIASVIPFIRKKFQATFPNYPFEYLILNDFYNQQFFKEYQLLKMLQAFVLVAILISTINLFAMAWFIAIARTKEIGIRKVNGAKISEVMTMLNKDFVKWVAIAFVIATPVAWFAMNKWLENFAYKTSLSWWIFALAGILAIGVALLTVSWQSWKAAARNPVEALRNE